MIYAAILLPALAVPFLGLVGKPMFGAIANLLFSLAVFGLTAAAFLNPGQGLIHADMLGLIFGLLTGFVGATTAFANLAFVRSGNEKMTIRRWRV